MGLEFSEEQVEAFFNMKNGCILCGGVGSGKSRTALVYFVDKVCGGEVPLDLGDSREAFPFYPGCCYIPMNRPRDLYIITTAKKRDSKEWQGEAANFGLPNENVKVTIDSWNNIKKYKDVYGAFFIFDEQRVVGSGSWVKSFLTITRKNQWILLSATPGDQWTDYIPVFIANGFYKNKTEFNTRHCVYSRYSKYPKIEKYVGEWLLEKHREDILVPIKMKRQTIRNSRYIRCEYDRNLYRTVMRDRWDPYENEPIAETGKLVYLLRKVANSSEDRIRKMDEILGSKKKLIIFYNFDYELEMLREYLNEKSYIYAEWNGKKHEEVPFGERWVYLVQYASGAEGWNCITTDTIVFFSQNYSYRMTEQAAGRIDRRNTPYKHLYYYHFLSNSPIDLAIYEKLKNKQNFNESSFLQNRRKQNE